MKKTHLRSVNLDLLRILSMLLIIFLHSIDHSGVLENAENCGTGMYFYVRFTYALCMVCVNIYILLSGYFMVTSKFRLQKLAALWMEASFYAVVLKLLFMLLGKEPFSVISLISCFVPILTGRYWFLTIYVGMYLISPFLNILIQALGKARHGMLNLCLFAIMSVWISLHPVIAGMNSGGGWGLAWFVTLYLAAAWLRLYYTPNYRPLRWLLVYTAIPLVISVLQCLPLPGVAARAVNNWFRYDSAPVYVMSLCLFIGFLNVRIAGAWLSAVITRVAPLTLGVYLIHAHANVSPWSWEVLALPGKMGQWTFIPIQIGVVLGIFAICAALDAVRKMTVGRLDKCGFVHKLCDQITDLFARIEKIFAKE